MAMREGSKIYGEEGTQIASLKWKSEWNWSQIYDTLDMIKTDVKL
jgi:hypothetical protein